LERLDIKEQKEGENKERRSALDRLDKKVVHNGGDGDYHDKNRKLSLSSSNDRKARTRKSESSEANDLQSRHKFKEDAVQRRCSVSASSSSSDDEVVYRKVQSKVLVDVKSRTVGPALVVNDTSKDKLRGRSNSPQTNVDIKKDTAVSRSSGKHEKKLNRDQSPRDNSSSKNDSVKKSQTRRSRSSSSSSDARRRKPSDKTTVKESMQVRNVTVTEKRKVIATQKPIPGKSQNQSIERSGESGAKHVHSSNSSPDHPKVKNVSGSKAISGRNSSTSASPDVIRKPNNGIALEKQGGTLRKSASLSPSRLEKNGQLRKQAVELKSRRRYDSSSSPEKSRLDSSSKKTETSSNRDGKSFESSIVKKKVQSQSPEKKTDAVSAKHKSPPKKNHQSRPSKRSRSDSRSSSSPNRSKPKSSVKEMHSSVKDSEIRKVQSKTSLPKYKKKSVSRSSSSSSSSGSSSTSSESESDNEGQSNKLRKKLPVKSDKSNVRQPVDSVPLQAVKVSSEQGPKLQNAENKR